MNELEQFCAGEPAVNQQVVKAKPLHNGLSEHLDGVGYLGLEHLLLSGIDLLVLTPLLVVLGSLLLLGKSLWLISILAGLCLYGGIHHQLRLAVGVAEEHDLEAQDAFHCSMRKHPSKAFSLHSPFRKVDIVKDDTTGGALRVSPTADNPDELAVDGVDNAAPVDTPIVHQAIERVLLAGEQLAKRTISVVRRGFDRKERLHNEQFHQLNEGELAVRILNRTNRFSLYDEPVHHSVYRIDRLAGVIMFEKVFEFREYLSIFVHG